MFGKISRHRDERKSFLRKRYEDAHNCFSKVGECSFGGDGGLGKVTILNENKNLRKQSNNF